MVDHPLDFNTRKALCVQLGEQAGHDISELIRSMAEKIATLERSKVDVIPISPDGAKQVRLAAEKLA